MSFLPKFRYEYVGGSDIIETLGLALLTWATKLSEEIGDSGIIAIEISLV